MPGTKTIFNILISIIVIVAAVFAYRFFFPKAATDSQTPALEPLGISTGNAANQDEFLRLLLSLQAIDFNTEVFDTLHKGSFQDFTVELVAKTPGRPNPFAPIGSDERAATLVSSSTAAKATTTPKR